MISHQPYWEKPKTAATCHKYSTSGGFSFVYQTQESDQKTDTRNYITKLKMSWQFLFYYWKMFWLLTKAERKWQKGASLLHEPPVQRRWALLRLYAELLPVSNPYALLSLKIKVRLCNEKAFAFLLSRSVSQPIICAHFSPPCTKPLFEAIPTFPLGFRGQGDL